MSVLASGFDVLAYAWYGQASPRRWMVLAARPEGARLPRSAGDGGRPRERIPRPQWFNELAHDHGVAIPNQGASHEPQALTLMGVVCLGAGSFVEDRSSWTEQAWLLWESMLFVADAYTVIVLAHVRLQATMSLHTVCVPLARVPHSRHNCRPYTGRQHIAYAGVPIGNLRTEDGRCISSICGTDDPLVFVVSRPIADLVFVGAWKSLLALGRWTPKRCTELRLLLGWPDDEWLRCCSTAVVQELAPQAENAPLSDIMSPLLSVRALPLGVPISGSVRLSCVFECRLTHDCV